MKLSNFSISEVTSSTWQKNNFLASSMLMFWRWESSNWLFKLRRTCSVQHDLWYNISAEKGSGVESTKYVIFLHILLSFKSGTCFLKSCHLELCSILNSLLDVRFGCFISYFFKHHTHWFFFWMNPFDNRVLFCNGEVGSESEWTGDWDVDVGISFAVPLDLASRIITCSRFFDEHKVM